MEMDLAREAVYDISPFLPGTAAAYGQLLICFSLKEPPPNSSPTISVSPQ